MRKNKKRQNNTNNAEEFNFVYGLNKRFPNPDLVIYLDIPLEMALSRLDNVVLKEVYETQEKLQQVKDNYLAGRLSD